MFKTALLSSCLSVFLITTAQAQSAGETIVTPQEFETLSTGKTLYFERDGRFFGAEQFYTRRRSLWMNGANQCQDGEWFAKGDLICFDYNTELDPQCWHFIKKSGKYSARAEGSTAQFDILMNNIDTKPLDCKGPAYGA